MKEADEIQLPIGWVKVRLNEITGRKGLISDGDWVESKDQDKNGNVRLIQLADIGDGFFKDVSSRFLTKEKADELNCVFLKEGDILIARMPDPLGRACIFPINKLERYVTVVDVCIVRVDNDYVSRRLLKFFLNTPFVRQEIEKRKSGTTRKRISKKNLLKIDLPFPPLAEQHRIVAKIEELFSELDNGIAQLRQVQTQLKSYRQSVLKHAFEGKLTEVWQQQHDQLPNAQELLTTIQQERHTRHQQALKDWQQSVIQWAEAGKPGKKPLKPKAPKELSPLTDEEIEKLPVLPEGWMWVKFDQLIASLRNGISRKPLEGGKLPILRISSTRPFKVDLSDRRYLDFDSSYDSYALVNGDLLFTRYNGSRDYVGVCGMVRNLSEKVVYPDKLIRCRIANENKILPAFIEYAANLGASRKFILDRIRTTAGQSGVSGGDIYAIPVPLCSTEEQHQIVQEIESRLSVADHLEKTVGESLRQAEVLRQSILQRAFTGQLILQDPNDEPAAELLKRIQQEKSDDTKNESGVKTKTSNHQPKEQLSIF